MATIPDFTTWSDDDLYKIRIAAATETERRQIVKNAQWQAEQLADTYANAVKDQPAKTWAAGTVVGPGEKITENGTEFVNTSGAWLSAPPSAYPLGFQRTKAPVGAPAWDGNSKAYKAGDMVTYNGVVYQVVQAHTSQAGWTPSAVPALYTKA